MKNQVLLLLCLTACLLQVYGQTDDQWLIKDGIGKTGATDLGSGQYENIFPVPPNNAIGGQYFSMGPISHPDRHNNLRAKNDLFVIYSDWSFFSTREKGVISYAVDKDIFFPYGDPPIGRNIADLIHNFQTPLAIKYLYLTNIYEDDDPPENLNVNPGQSGSNINKYQLGISPTPSEFMIANHDVIKDADITLIIWKEAITLGKKLWFNKVKLKQIGSLEVPGNFFEPSNVFSGSCSNATITDNQDGSITFTALPSTANYVYVNLKPTGDLPAYYPNGEDNYEAIFLLERNGVTINDVILKEDILSSHDPNFIQVISTCRHEKGGKYVYYHVEFYNSGNDIADHLSVKLKLPNYLDLHCIGSGNWVVAGEPSSGTISMNQNSEIIFTFKPEDKLLPYNADEVELSTGYVEFCVKIKDNVSTPMSDLDFKITDPFVYFGQDEYSIDNFNELNGPEDPGPDTNFPNPWRKCKCKCSPIRSHSSPSPFGAIKK